MTANAKNKSEIPVTVDSPSEYRNIPVSELVESPTNPRKAFDEERLEELAASIRTHGVLSPLLVRRVIGPLKSWPERGGSALRNAPEFPKFPPASNTSPMPKHRNCKSSKTFSGPMFIRSKKRKASAHCSTEKAPNTPFSELRRESRNPLRM